MYRIVVAGLMAAILAPTALAADGPEVCILQATETITAPRKPNIFTNKMNCGTEPTMEQEAAVASVASTANAADAVSFMLGLGYELEEGTTFVSYTGNAIMSTFVMIKEGGGPKDMDDDLDDLSDFDGLEDVDDLPESGDALVPDLDAAEAELEEIERKAAEKAAKEAEEAAEDAIDEAEDAIDDAEEAVDDAIDDAAEALDGAF